MTLGGFVAIAICVSLYALLGLYVGLDIADGNRGIRYSTRSNPWVGGILWLPIYIIVAGILLIDYLKAGGADKHRR